MQNAYSMYFKGDIFNDNNRRFLPDHTFGAGLKEGDKYFDLYQEAIKHSAIRRGVGYELTELRKRSAEDFTGTRSKIETGLGWLFQNSERMNREVTLIAAYDLAMKRNGGNKEAAIKKHLDSITKNPDEMANIYSLNAYMRELIGTKDLVPASLKAISKTKAKADLEAAAKKAPEATPTPISSLKVVIKKTITCIKGKLIKKVTAVKPTCPNGYKKK